MKLGEFEIQSFSSGKYNLIGIQVPVGILLWANLQSHAQGGEVKSKFFLQGINK
tara:strand:+ start:4440 stop:4601 length:162 start_codon:yes stop_codon:yes gene_type:complete